MTTNDTTTDLLTNPQGKDTANSQPSEAEILANLVGDGKPFKSVEALAKSKKEADDFIEKLKSENADMRKLLSSKETSEKTNELLQTLMAKLNTPDGGDPGNQSGTALSREEIVTMVRNQVTEEQKARDRVANRIKANSEVLKFYANDEAKARAHVQSKAQELGLSLEALASMAETQPQVFTALMGVGPRPSKVGSPLPAGGSKPGEPLNGGDSGPRNFAFYKELHKKLGDAKFYQPKIQQQLIADRKTLGEEFFDKR